MTTTSIKTLAHQTHEAFETRTRDDGSRFFALRDGSPKWMMELCHEAHGDMLPDDTRYGFIVEALDALSEADDADDITLEADIYTHDLTAWLGSRADRYSYCDQALEDYGLDTMPEGGTIGLLGMGQAYEKAEVLAQVRYFLERRVDEAGDSED